MNQSEVTVKLTGVSELLLHNNQAASPFNEYCKILKPLTSKRKKTDSDYIEIARIEWEAGLYLNDGIVVIPARCFDRCFLEAAKRTKQGKQWTQGAMIITDYWPLEYPKKIKLNGTGKKQEVPNPELDMLYKTHIHQEMVKVNMQQILRTRPIFHEWSTSGTIIYDDEVMNERNIIQIIETAGRFIGLCERRPRNGRFSVEKL